MERLSSVNRTDVFSAFADSVQNLVDQLGSFGVKAYCAALRTETRFNVEALGKNHLWQSLSNEKLSFLFNESR
jgi:hypothetical protein